MDPRAGAFTGSYPDRYDRLLVPLLFEPYARVLAKRVHDLAPDNLLEVAAGTGAVTRALVAALPRAVAITATDLNQPMLDIGRAHPGMERVTWQQADAANLPFSARSFAGAVCQFGVMFFPDKRAAFREIVRVLRPGGWLMFSVWDRLEQMPLLNIAAQMTGAMLAVDPGSLVAPAYFDIEMIRADLSAAGFGSVDAETLRLRSTAASAREAAVAYCHGSMVRTVIEAYDPALLEETTDKVSHAIAERYGNGRVDTPTQAILFIAWRPL